MNELRYTLLSDGSSDRALIPILTWLLQQHLLDCALQNEWADLARLPNPPQDFPDRIRQTLELYPCDLLFVHRDAESESRETRRDEIMDAWEKAAGSATASSAVCVIPVRMTEAWLLFDLGAIRKAAGNPNGVIPLDLPPLQRLESLPDPKKDLYEVLLEASELPGRRRKTFRVAERVHRVSEYIDDFSPLRQLSAFQGLEEDLRETIRRNRWEGGTQSA